MFTELVYKPTCHLCQGVFFQFEKNAIFSRFKHPAPDLKAGTPCKNKNLVRFLNNKLIPDLQTTDALPSSDWWTLRPSRAETPPILPLVRFEQLEKFSKWYPSLPGFKANGFTWEAVKYSVPSWAIGTKLLAAVEEADLPLTAAQLESHGDFDLVSIVHCADFYYLWADREVIKVEEVLPMTFTTKSKITEIHEVGSGKSRQMFIPL